MDDEETELRNPFPSPPSHYTRYTNHNLKLLELLKERAGEGVNIGTLNQYEVLSDQADVPEWPLATLEKPRVDWILEEGHYTVFVDTWFVSRARFASSVERPNSMHALLDQGDYSFSSRARRTPVVPAGSQCRYVLNMVTSTRSHVVNIAL